MNPGNIKLGPGFFVNGDKKVMMMTRAIDAFNFGIDTTLKTIDSAGSVQDIDYLPLFNNIINSLVADTLLYFTNRIGQMMGTEIKGITSIPDGKSMLQKKFYVDIKHLIGDKGYRELKKLDESRGKKQHKNDRYFIDFKVNKTDLNNPKYLRAYVVKVQKIVEELDHKLDQIKETHRVTIASEGNTTTITTQAITHSFDLKKGKMNKKENIG